MSQHDITYADLLRHVLQNGRSHSDRTGVGTTSVFGYQARFPEKHGFPLLTTKRMAWRSIVTELRWFLLGRTDNQWLVDRKCTIWAEWSTEQACAKFGRSAGDLGPVYGHQWRRFGEVEDADDSEDTNDRSLPGIDQIKQLCRDLANNPGSRRLIVSAWNPAEATQVALPPCHTLWQCKVHEDPSGMTKGILDLQLYQRSADSFLGVPFNIASYALLQHLLAYTHGMACGDFVHAFGDLHIYNNHREVVGVQLQRTGFPPPCLILHPDLWGSGFDGLMRFAQDDSHSLIRLDDYVCHEALKAEVAV